MDNLASQPSIVPPTVPADFEAKAGNSRVDFAKALFALLAGAKISGIIAAEPSPYDLAAISSQLAQIQIAADKIIARTPRRIVLAGIANGVLTVPFQDIGTVNYQVDVAFVSPNSDLPDSLMWAIIKDSKQTAQVNIRVNGNAAAMDIEVTITPMDNI